MPYHTLPSMTNLEAAELLTTQLSRSQDPLGTRKRIITKQGGGSKDEII